MPSDVTQRCYNGDYRSFERWCGKRGAVSLPAHPLVVVSYVNDIAREGKRASTITRRVAAIGHHHRLAGFDPPDVAHKVREITLRLGRGKQPKTPITPDLLSRMLAKCPDTLKGKRDKALLPPALQPCPCPKHCQVLARR
jgi:hypothetical protein